MRKNHSNLATSMHGITIHNMNLPFCFINSFEFLKLCIALHLRRSVDHTLIDMAWGIEHTVEVSSSSSLLQSNITGPHCENMPIQTYCKFYHKKNENFQIKNSDIFHVSAQNIDCGYSLEPPRRGGSNGGSNEYPQSMF